MIITKTQVPSDSILNTKDVNYDYADSYLTSITDSKNLITAKDIGKAFFSSAPKWVGYLFELRNKLAATVGLKTSGTRQNRQKLLENFKCEAGEQLGLFKVYQTTENEIILGEDDKHLNFRISLLITPNSEAKELKNITISTTVKFCNWFGRLYFLPVQHFHKLIVPAMLKGIVKELEKKQQAV